MMAYIVSTVCYVSHLNIFKICLLNFSEWPDAKKHMREEKIKIKAKLLEKKRYISPSDQLEKRRDYYENWYAAAWPSDYVPSFSSVNYN